ncbi:TniQ family protein [Streptomyces sp. NPDC101062]|uniref:TniQ family protein n=1 Tax=Streptomyces sp. NPDC101062 TaxID=3366103 RepID=UPI0038267D8A
MIAARRTLPVRLSPHPGEALDSWTEALAARLHCPLGDLTTALGLEAAGEPDKEHRGHKPPNWTVALDDSEAHTVADACGLDAEGVHALTLMRYHRRAVIVFPATRRVDRTTLWGRANGSRFCPRCLAESGGRWLLAWRLGWSFACTRHRILLTDTCWQCHRLQRLRVPPAGTVPVPGHCTNPGPGSGRAVPRCGADLTSTPVLALPQDHLALRTQYLIMESVRSGVADFGLYERAPVAEFLTDVRMLSKNLLTHPDQDELTWRLPTEIAAPYEQARALPHSKTSPTASRARPGFASPARAEITAAAATLAVEALSLATTGEAGARLAWLFAPSAAPAPRTAASKYQASELVLDIRREALRRLPAAITSGAGPRRTDRASKIPSLLWPAWTVALTPTHRHYKQTFRGLAHALAVLLILDGPGDSIARASRQLGSCQPADSVAELVHRLRRLPDWAAIDAALGQAMRYLDNHNCPIDYERRRHLDYNTLLLTEDWLALSRRAGHFPGDDRRPFTARRWLFERISGMPADQAPAAFTLTEPRQRNEVSGFSTHLTPELLREFDQYALTFLNKHGATGEPVTWTPPTAGLQVLQLPGTLHDRLPTQEIHHLIRRERLAPRTIARRFNVSVDAIRAVLHEHPAPLTLRQQRANGRLTWELAEQLSAQDLQRLHHDEQHSIKALAEKFLVPATVITDLLERHGVPVVLRQRSMPKIDREWLHREYVINRRPIPELAKAVGVSTSYLRRRARHWNIPVRDKGGAAHAPERLFGPAERQAAVKMLRTGNYSVYEVAHELGFTTTTLRRHTTKEERSHVPKRSPRPRPT